MAQPVTDLTQPWCPLPRNLLRPPSPTPPPRGSTPRGEPLMRVAGLRAAKMEREQDDAPLATEDLTNSSAMTTRTSLRDRITATPTASPHPPRPLHCPPRGSTSMSERWGGRRPPDPPPLVLLPLLLTLGGQGAGGRSGSVRTPSVSSGTPAPITASSVPFGEAPPEPGALLPRSTSSRSRVLTVGGG
jgi:hypothetical protein